MRAQRSGGSATSIDVANLAGVSQPTVSRALRDDQAVSPATRARVHKAAAELKYVPSQRGRALATRRTGRVGVVVADLANPFYLQLLDLLQAELSAASLGMVVFTDADNELDADQLLDGSIDGAVLTTTLLDSEISDELVAQEFPIVMLNRYNDSSVADVCTADNQGGAALVARELVTLGHTSIGAIFGPPNTSTGRDRRHGFEQALAEHGIELEPHNVREGAFSFGAGHSGLTELMTGPTPPTAIFCANDVIALGAMNAAHRLGIGIPEQLTLIGFDDIAMADWALFSLTTVAQNMDQLAAHAVERLRRRIEDTTAPVGRLRVRTELIRRSTHGRP